ncbi:MAG: N-acetylornithine carbamoyltransferase [Patescibacteria group bacterium]
MNLKGKHFYNTADFTLKEINYLIDLAIQMKQKGYKQVMKNKSMALFFFNPSIRTRTSFASAVNKLGGLPIDLPTGGEGIFTLEFQDNVVMDKNTKEHIKEAASLVSRYCQIIGIRSSELITNKASVENASSWENQKKDTVLKGFMKYATVPVISMESNIYHPCQGLGDAMTIKEKLGNPKGKKYSLVWSYHPKALPMAVTNSQLISACQLGMDVILAHPKGWELDNEILKTITKTSKEAGGNFKITNSMNEAYNNADVICTKSWGALKYYGNWEEEKKIREQHKDWIVDKEKMVKTDQAIFMHCLPVRRNVEVTDEVIDSKNSVVIDEAENRMWAQMAIIKSLLNK